MEDKLKISDMTELSELFGDMKPLMNSLISSLENTFKDIGTTRNPTSAETAPESSDDKVKPDVSKTMSTPLEILNGLFKVSPYITMMPFMFKVLSKLKSESDIEPDSEQSKNIDLIKTEASSICEMLKDKSPEEVHPMPEFKARLIVLTVNFNRLVIWELEKMEASLLDNNEETPVDTLLETLFLRVTTDKKLVTG